MPEKTEGGAPTKYQADYAHMAEVACSEAPFTDLKLSKLFNVSKSTIRNSIRRSSQALSKCHFGYHHLDPR